MVETELNAIGAYKISMPILGSKELWQKTGRWSTFESEMFHLSDKTNQAFCLQPTHEEMVAKLVAEQGNSFSYCEVLNFRDAWVSRFCFSILR